MLNTLKEVFGHHSDNVFLVGGTVRDIIQGHVPNDIDLVAKVEPGVLLSLGAKYIDPKTAFPVFALHHNTLGKIDIALPRLERSVGNKHQDFSIITSSDIPLEMDLLRRDFTINSMAMNLQGDIIDPYNGRIDLFNRILKHTSDAFIEDSLRVFRAYRFSCKGFTIDEELIKVIKTMDITTLPGERVYNEMMKAMCYEYPENFFLNVRKLGGYHFFKIIFKMDRVPAGPKQYHPEGSVFEHSIECLKKVKGLTNDPYIRLSVFLHDAGKVCTPKEEWPSHHGHDDHYGDTLKMLNKLKAEKKTLKIVEGVIRSHMRAAKMKLGIKDGMKKKKWLNITNKAISGGFLKALMHTVFIDADINISKELNLTAKVIGMNIQDLGLTLDDLKDKTGESIKNMVHSARVRKLSKLIKEGGLD